MQLICDSELLLTRNVCRLRAVMPTQTRNRSRRYLPRSARAPPHITQDLPPIACIPGTLFSRSLAVPSSRRPQITGDSDRDTHVRITNALEGPPTTSQGREAAQSTSLPELAYKIVLKPPAVTISEVLSGIITFLYAFFACAVVASRRRAGRWSSPPAPRRARAPAASTRSSGFNETLGILGHSRAYSGKLASSGH